MPPKKRKSLSDDLAVASTSELPKNRLARQAFNLPKTAAVKALIERNAAESPLLRLPREIRDKIWMEVLGGKTIRNRRLHGITTAPGHSSWSYRYPVDEISKQTFSDHSEEVICERYPKDVTAFEKACYQEMIETAYMRDCLMDEYELSGDLIDDAFAWAGGEIFCPDYPLGVEELNLSRILRLEGKVTAEAQNEQKQVPDEPSSQPDLSHYRISWEDSGPSEYKYSLIDRPQLQILRACRQTYLEANTILWTTNNFAFESVDSLVSFIEARNAVQRKLLRSISLTLQGDYSAEFEPWNRSCKMKHIKLMQGLRSLHLCVDATLLTTMARAGPWSPRPYIWENLLYRSFLRNFKALPLETFKVIIREERGSDRETDPNCFSWAKDFQSYLLNGNGPAWLRAEIDSDKRFAQEMRDRTKTYLRQLYCRHPSQTACISDLQHRKDVKTDKAGKTRKTIMEHCGRMHRSCKPACKEKCEHIEYPSVAEELLTVSVESEQLSSPELGVAN